MGQVDGFRKYDRTLPDKETVETRVQHFNEFVKEGTTTLLEQQSARCMDCGIPFCHSACPLGNLIPDFNEAVYREDWKKAYEFLIATNNFPEFTGRICPAPCEGSCVLGINSDAVAIEYIEKSIIEMAFNSGWVKPKIPEQETGKNVAIIGSGPTGLACADQLRFMGHAITIYERADRAGGLLRYGIPDFKLGKQILDRRLSLMKKAEIKFQTSTNIGIDIDPAILIKNNDAVVLCGGSTVARDLNIEGRSYKGIHLAMDFLTGINKQVAGDSLITIDCKDKNILVIGGGDTGSDCIGTSNRLGAKSVTQIELLSKPPAVRSADNPWPNWPMVLRTSSSHEEGTEREWCISTKRFLSADGINLSGVEIVKVRWEKEATGRYQMQEIPQSSRIIKCDLVFLAIGFIHPLLDGQFSALDIQLDQRKNIKTADYQTSVSKLFAAGDMRIGQSIVVRAIDEGRKVAEKVHHFLCNKKDAINREKPFGLL